MDSVQTHASHWFGFTWVKALRLQKDPRGHLSEKLHRPSNAPAAEGRWPGRNYKGSFSSPNGRQILELLRHSRSRELEKHTGGTRKAGWWQIRNSWFQSPYFLCLLRPQLYINCMQMCLLYILFQSESLSCEELYQHVSRVEETSDVSGNISDKQTQCYDISKLRKHGRGPQRWWRRRGDKATESRSVYPGTCTVWSAESKIGFYYLCWVLGGVSLICGINAFCQLKREPAWRVTGHFSLGRPWWSCRRGSGKKRKDKPTGLT